MKSPGPLCHSAHLFLLLELYSALTPSSLVPSLLILKNQFENNSSKKRSHITPVPEVAAPWERLAEMISWTVVMALKSVTIDSVGAALTEAQASCFTWRASLHPHKHPMNYILLFFHPCLEIWRSDSYSYYNCSSIFYSYITEKVSVIVTEIWRS